MQKPAALNVFLKANGIQPHVFSFFLYSFINKEAKKKPREHDLKYHLSRVLVAQAELIRYHLLRH